MKNISQIKCPLCNGDRSEVLFVLNSGSMDDSALYRNIKVKSCCRCGHIYNELNENDCDRLSDYYNNEFSWINQNSKNELTDLPGSSNPNTQKRYQRLIEMVPELDISCSVLDVGCASGGLLKHLRNMGLTKLCGIDSAASYLNQPKKLGYEVKQGMAESIPYGDSEFDVVFLDQVLEHCVNPSSIFQEVKRVLKLGGVFCIGVPDASRYSDFYFFDYFWFLMKEHIQHFDINHLIYFARNEGFELVTSQHNEMVINEKMIQPNLNVVFKSVSPIASSFCETEKVGFELKEKLNSYVNLEEARFKKRLNHLLKLISAKDRCTYFWGVSRELLFMLENLPSHYLKNYKLIDKNAFKQTQQYSQKRVYPPSILDNAPINSVLIITGVAHTESIKAEVYNIGFKGKVYALGELE